MIHVYIWFILRPGSAIKTKNYNASKIILKNTFSYNYLQI